MVSMLDDDFCTIPEAAKSLRVSMSTIWRWIDSGRLAAYRVGQRRIRIKKEDLAMVVRPFREEKAPETPEAREGMEIVKMSPLDAKDQTALIRKARALQEQVLARRGGKLLPPSWEEIAQDRLERAARQ